MIDPIARTVMTLMRSHGGDMELIQKVDGGYDPVTSRVTSTETVYTVRGMVFDYLPKMGGVMVAADTLIQAGDKQVFVKPEDDLPTILPKSFSLIIAGRKYNVIAVKELNPSGANRILYELYVRA